MKLKIFSKYPLLLVALTCVLYGNTLPNQYAIDDPFVTNNPLVQKGVKAIPEIFATRYRVTGEYNYGYRPIVKSTYAIEYSLFGQNPWVSHLLNLLFYALTAVFLYFLLRKLLHDYDDLLPFIIVALFVAHPVHTEAVASLKNREEIFGFFGSIAALYSFLKFNENRKIKHIIFGLLWFVFAFFSKQNALTFLAVIPLAIYFFSDTQEGFIKGISKFFISRLSSGTRNFLGNVARYGSFLFSLAKRYKYLLLSLVFYTMAIINAKGDFYQFSIVTMLVHFALDSSDKRAKWLGIIKNPFIITALTFLTGVLISSNLRTAGLFETDYPKTILGMLAVLSFATYFYKYNSEIITKALKFIKNPLIILSFISWAVGVKIASYNIYDIALFALNTVAIFATYIYFSKRSHYDEKLQVADKLSDKNSTEESELTSSEFTIPTSYRAIIVTVLLLAATAYVVMNAPNIYLPEEQREIQAFENPLFFESNVWVTIATGFYSLLIYLKLLFVPHPLVFYYGFNHVPVVSMDNGWVILSILVHIILLVVAIKGIKKKSIISFGIFYYLATISIFANIVIPIPGIVGERLLFMPSLGFCLILGFGIYKLFAKQEVIGLTAKTKRNIILLTVLILVPYSVKTITRNFDWKDHLTLYLHDIPYLENSLHANALVASHVLREIDPNAQTPAQIADNKKNLALVEKHFEQVLTLDPLHVPTLNNLGTVYYDFYRDYEKALSYFERVPESAPEFAESNFNVGYCYELLGKDQMAKAAYLKVMDIRDDHISTMSNLANLYFKLGVKDSAIFLNERIMALDSLLDIPYVNVGNYYIQVGKEPQAVELFEKAIRLNPKNRALCQNLSEYFKMIGEVDKAAYYAKLSSK